MCHWNEDGYVTEAPIDKNKVLEGVLIREVALIGTRLPNRMMMLGCRGLSVLDEMHITIDYI